MNNYHIKLSSLGSKSALLYSCHLRAGAGVILCQMTYRSTHSPPLLNMGKTDIYAG